MTRNLTGKAIKVFGHQGRDTTSPTVSVVIPCFNYARFLPAAVTSVLTQSGVTVNVIIVDDASTDESLTVARRFAAEDPRVVVISHSVNHGPVKTFNDGLEAAHGEFLVRLDADDLLTPGSLHRSTTLARAWPEVGLVYGRPVHFTSDVPPTRFRSRVRSWTIWPGQRWLSARCASGVNVITSPEALMRMSVVRRVGGQQDLAHTHDMEMWFRIAAFSDVAYLNGPDQAWHRDHVKSLSTAVDNPVDSLVGRRAAFETLFGGIAGSEPEAPQLLNSARHALAAEALDRACREFERSRAKPDQVGALIEFAKSTSPSVEATRAWRRLCRRMQAGSPSASRKLWYFFTAASRRTREEWRHLRWTRSGVYGRS